MVDGNLDYIVSYYLTCTQNERGLAYEGPSSWMLRLASHWPMSMLSSRDLPCTIPAEKPPANASLGHVSTKGSLHG